MIKWILSWFLSFREQIRHFPKTNSSKQKHFQLFNNNELTEHFNTHECHTVLFHAKLTFQITNKNPHKNWCTTPFLAYFNRVWLVTSAPCTSDKRYRKINNILQVSQKSKLNENYWVDVYHSNLFTMSRHLFRF